MSADFLTDNQVQNYGRYAAEPNEVQLARYFHLDERDLDFVNQRRGRHNRLGIALQLTTARFLGTFISDLMQIPAGVRFYVAAQLGISRPEILSRYAQRENTLWEHHALIRQYYGYHDFGDFPWSFRLKRLLYIRVWLSNERPGLMFDFATAWLLQHKVLLPAASTLTRLIGEIRERANRRLWRKLASLPDSWQTAQLAGLLEIPAGQRVSVMEQLRKGPVTVSGPSFTEALERYTRLRNLEFSRLNFSGLPAAQLRNLARYAGMTSTRYIARMPEVRRLSWVKQNYLRAETLVSANARLVDFQSMLELAGRWGGGEVASADGMRFVTPVKTLNAGPNRKYFGSGRGITWYNFISDQYSGFHGIVIPGTLRDSIFVLEGLLEQQTGLNPVEIMTDTAGASDIIFGLFWLLGYQFSPRLADAGEAVFWRIDKNAHYCALDELARGCVDLPRIESHWDEMMRASGSLKLGTIHASELVRSLLRSTRPSGLALAIMEVGRVNKTLYLLNYIDDEDYRRRILTQLNRGEGRHDVARAICYGQRGEIRKRYREGQEDQLGALGLVTNAVVLWNSLYMQEALAHLRTTTGVTPDDEHIARLSPLMHGHINMLGHYTFTLPDDILKGELRPLNLNINNELSP